MPPKKPKPVPKQITLNEEQQAVSLESWFFAVIEHLRVRGGRKVLLNLEDLSTLICNYWEGVDSVEQAKLLLGDVTD